MIVKVDLAGGGRVEMFLNCFDLKGIALSQLHGLVGA